MAEGVKVRSDRQLARARTAICFVLICLAMAECGLRLAGERPRIASRGSERYGYALLPDQVGPDGRRVNGAGFYGDVDWAPPADGDGVSVVDGGTSGLRVAVFDSSVGAGEGVPPGASWPRQLEGRLAEAYPDRDVLVMNHSVGGWGVEAFERLYADRVEAYRPDVVVFSISDISALPVVVRGTPESWFRPLLERSVLFDMAQRTLMRDRGDGPAAPRTAEEARRQALFGEMYAAPRAERFDEHWREAARRIRAVQARQREHGGRVLVLFAPLVQHWLLRGGERRPAARPGAWAGLETIDPFLDWSPGVGAWIDTATALGADRTTVRAAVDRRAAAPLAEFGTPAEFLPDDPAHWTVEGHRAIAEIVAAAITGPR